VLDIPGTGTHVHAICVHLGLRDGHRKRQVQLLCEILADEVPPQAPLIIAGDFNDWRLRAHATLQKCQLREAFIDSHGRPAKTFPARHPLLPLDRIYLRNATAHRPKVLSVRPWSHLSDHAPLFAEVRI